MKILLEHGANYDRIKNNLGQTPFDFELALMKNDDDLIKSCFSYQKFLDAGIQDVSTSISIEFKIEYLDELIEMSDGDESDKHI